jgi:hypothetical protein
MATNEIKVDRTPRDSATREQTARPTSWKPASAVPAVDDRPGWKHRWIRKAMYGQLDPTNLSKKRREGWVPCQLNDYPELRGFIDPESEASGMIEIGGLVLHRISVETSRARQEYYAERNQQEIRAAEAMYANQAGATSTMPLFKDNKSHTKFGSGQ